MVNKISIIGFLAAVLVSGVAGVAAAESRIVLKNGLNDEWSCAQWIMNNANKDAGQYECQYNAGDGWAVIWVTP